MDYGEYAKKRGLSLLCSPGNDVESTTALAGSGANLILFTTGLGTPTGNPVAPVIKISSNTETALQMEEIIDVNAGTIIDGGENLEEKPNFLLDGIIAVASGEKKVSVKLSFPIEIGAFTQTEHFAGLLDLSIILCKPQYPQFELPSQILFNSPDMKARNWGKAIGRAGKKELSLVEIERLQNIVIGTKKLKHMGIRTNEGFIGERDRESFLPMPDHISARAKDLHSLTSSLPNETTIALPMMAFFEFHDNPHQTSP